MSIQMNGTLFGKVTLDGAETLWQVTHEFRKITDGVEDLFLHFHAAQPAEIHKITLCWERPQLDVQASWFASGSNFGPIPADWAAPRDSFLASGCPVGSLYSQSGENRQLIAVSDAKRRVRIRSGVHEETNDIWNLVELFSEPEAAFSDCSVTVRLDLRTIFYADAIREGCAWISAQKEYSPADPPPEAFDPVYSSWYTYHQNVFAEELENECREAARLGLKTLIVDDGWQTDDNHRGYAYTGDWEISRRRFPDMRKHVENVHALGLKYMLWYSVPFVGFGSRNYARFKGMYLNSWDSQKTAVLDPRFPEVRDFLIRTWETAVREWDLDGFKLDFIDAFGFPASGDPAAAEDYRGRDFKSLPDGVDALLSEAMRRLNALKKGILIEFRQSYIGPAVRKYGNMLRSGDCPGDALTNRRHTVDLRLTSGNTAVHSDMIEWNLADTAEHAALQFLNILFSVPQISVKLESLPESHARMLRFWMTFWREHRETLLHGSFRPYHPELSYPLIESSDGSETIFGVYAPDSCIRVPASSRVTYAVNASSGKSLVLELPGDCTAETFTAEGVPVLRRELSAGLVRLEVPCSGLLKITSR